MGSDELRKELKCTSELMSSSMMKKNSNDNYFFIKLTVTVKMDQHVRMERV